MSTRDHQIDAERLRGCTEYALRFDVPHEGSLLLRLLGCVYLAAPFGAEPTLAREFYLQADSEGIDGDDLLTALLLAVPPSEVLS